MGTEAVTETPKWHLIVPQDIAAMSQEQAVVAGGLLPMEASAQYREFAQKCDEETKDPRHKQVLPRGGKAIAARIVFINT
jgi:hypothetical protein